MNVKNVHKDEEKDESTYRTKTQNGLQSAECVRTLIVLKQQEHIIEKSLSALITGMKTEFGENLRHEQFQLSTARAKLCDSLKNTLLDIADELKSVKSIVEDLQDIDVESCKSRLKSLWEKMEKFNKSDVLETLNKEQNALESELGEFHDKLPKYEKNGTAANSYSIYSKRTSNNKGYEFYDDVENFGNLVAKTGHTQHWSNEDHLLFLKLRKKCKNVPSLVIAMQKKCPDLSTECIVNHEAWYKIYLDLRQKQKEAVKEWRSKKDSKRLYKEEEDGLPEMNERSNEMLEQNLEEIKSKPIRLISSSATRAKLTNEEAEKKKELIRQWKSEQENQRLNEEEEERLRLKIKQEKEEKRKQARAVKMKMDLMEYKRRKLQEMEIRKMNTKKKIIVKPKGLMHYRQQDKRYIEKKRVLIKNHTIENQRPVKYRRKLLYPKHSTLFKTTKVWEERCKIEDPQNKQPISLMYIKDLPKMHTSYRRNMESL